MPEASFSHGLMFHHFCGGRHPEVQGAIDAETFDRMLDFAGAANILGAEEWAHRAARGTLEPEHRCVTFDDALRCQYDIALPVLEARRLTAFWFVYSAVFEGRDAPLEIYRWFRTTQFDSVDAFYAAFDQTLEATKHGTVVAQGLSRFDARAYLQGYDYFSTSDRRFRFIRDELLSPQDYDEIMAAMLDRHRIDRRSLHSLLWLDDACLVDLQNLGHVVGLHSYSHPTTLARLPIERQMDEYSRNHEHIARVIGRAPTTVSHPSNSYSPQTLDILNELGVTLGFRADMDGPVRSRLEHPRIDHANLLAEMNRK